MSQNKMVNPEILTAEINQKLISRTSREKLDPRERA